MKISKKSDELESENIWLSALKNQIEKNAVQSKKIDEYIFDRNSTNSSYLSVEDKVKEMMTRSGLVDYLKKISNKNEEESKNVKKASSKEEKPKLLLDYPEIDATIENYIRDTKGNLSVPAVLLKVKTIHNNDVQDTKLWKEDSLLKYISKLNTIEKENSNHKDENYNLGTIDKDNKDIDPENTDAFKSLLPAIASLQKTGLR